MIIELIGIVAPAEKREELCSALNSLLRPIQLEPGYLSGLLYQNWLDSNVIYLESRWETLNDMIRHIQSDTYKRLLLLMELGDEPPIIEIMTVSEIRGLDFIQVVRQGQYRVISG
jgi:quinol monooxygenase YgiN